MSKVRRLWLVLLLNLLLVAALVIVGVAAHSLGVLATGVDYLADAGSAGTQKFRTATSRTSAWAWTRRASRLIPECIPLIVAVAAKPPNPKPSTRGCEPLRRTGIRGDVELCGLTTPVEPSVRGALRSNITWLPKTLSCNDCRWPSTAADIRLTGRIRMRRRA